MVQRAKAVRVYRGAARAVDDALAKTTVTLPKALLAAADRAVIERKLLEPSFNRSAFVEEAMRAYLKRRGLKAARLG